MSTSVKCRFPLALFALSASFSAHADDQSPQRSVEERLDKLEQQSGTTRVMLPKSLQFTGLVQMQGAMGEDVNDNSYSDISVATVELGLSTEINDRISSQIVFLYEEGYTDFGVDVATVTVNKLVGPVDLTLGKMYVPFGHFETELVNDTLILSLAETRQTAALFSMEQDGLTLGGYIFDGSQDRERHAENYGLSASFNQQRWRGELNYISSLTESDSVFYQVIPGSWDKSAPAVSVSGKLKMDTLSFIAEYLTATEHMRLNPGDPGFKPEALQLEGDITAMLGKKDVTFALAYQSTREAGGFLPKQRVSLGTSYR